MFLLFRALHLAAFQDLWCHYCNNVAKFNQNPTTILKYVARMVVLLAVLRMPSPFLILKSKIYILAMDIGLARSPRIRPPSVRVLCTTGAKQCAPIILLCWAFRSLMFHASPVHSICAGHPLLLLTSPFITSTSPGFYSPCPPNPFSRCLLYPLPLTRYLHRIFAFVRISANTAAFHPRPRKKHAYSPCNR